MAKNHPNSIKRPLQGGSKNRLSMTNAADRQSNKQEDMSKRPLPDADDLEGTMAQFGHFTDAKRKIVDEAFQFLISRCNDNAIVFQEIAEHVSGAIFKQSMETGIGLSPTQYTRFLIGNTNLRVSIAANQLETQVEQQSQLLDMLKQQNEMLQQAIPESRDNPIERAKAELDQLDARIRRAKEAVIAYDAEPEKSPLSAQSRDQLTVQVKSMQGYSDALNTRIKQMEREADAAEEQKAQLVADQQAAQESAPEIDLPTDASADSTDAADISEDEDKVVSFEKECCGDGECGVCDEKEKVDTPAPGQ